MVVPGQEVTLTTQLAVELATPTRDRRVDIKTPPTVINNKDRAPDSKMRVSTKTSKKRMTFTSSSPAFHRKEMLVVRVKTIEEPTLIRTKITISMALIKGLSDAKARILLVGLVNISMTRTRRRGSNTGSVLAARELLTLTFSMRKHGTNNSGRSKTQSSGSNESRSRLSETTASQSSTTSKRVGSLARRTKKCAKSARKTTKSGTQQLMTLCIPRTVASLTSRSYVVIASRLLSAKSSGLKTKRLSGHSSPRPRMTKTSRTLKSNSKTKVKMEQKGRDYQIATR
jgi:hypothetical protein